jgi:hypothetical protein
MNVKTACLSGCLVASLIAAAACGGSEPSSTTPANPAPSTTVETTPPVDTATPPPAPTTEPAPTASAPPPAPTGPAMPAAWKDMDKKQRAEWMKTVVMPKMAKSFQGFDAKDFKDFTCVTCHGPGAKKGNFTMPNPGLPKLDAADGFKKHMTKKPEVTKFMMTQVVPEMADALQVPKYDPATHQGFGCFNCHVAKK